MTPCSNLYRASLSLVLCLLSLSFSVSAVGAPTAPTTWANPGNNIFPPHGSGQSVCEARAAAIGNTGTISYEQYTTASSPQGWTGSWGSFVKGNAAEGNCRSLSASSGNTSTIGYASLGQYCGPGATLVGSFPNATCSVCPSGYVDFGGQCVLPPDCPSAGSVVLPTALQGGFFVSFGSGFSTGPNGSTFCRPVPNGYCAAKCTTGFVGPNPIASGQVAVCTSLTFTGGTCATPSNTIDVQLENPLEVEPETGAGTSPSGPGDCPPGTGFAQINNKSSCLPSGTVGTGGSSSSSDSSGATSSSESDWKINGDGTTTMTTNSTTTSNGQTTSGSTTSTSGVNGAAGADGKDGKDFDPGPAPSWSDPGNGGNVPDASVGSLDSINWHQTFLPESGACALADIPFEAMGQSFNFPMSALCPYLPILRGIIIFISVVFSIRLFAMAPW